LQFLNDGSSFRHTQIENAILCFLVAFKQNLKEGMKEGRKEGKGREGSWTL
jgi:hypothetical protein